MPTPGGQLYVPSLYHQSYYQWFHWLNLKFTSSLVPSQYSQFSHRYLQQTPTIGVHNHYRETLQWRRNEWHDVSNHPCLDCLLKCLLRCISKKTSKLCVTCLCEGNPPVSGGFPSQRASDAENVSFWWCHHDLPTKKSSVWLSGKKYTICTDWLELKPLWQLGFYVHCKNSDNTKGANNLSLNSQHYEAKTKWPTFYRQHFIRHPLEWKSVYFDWDLNLVITVSADVLGPNGARKGTPALNTNCLSSLVISNNFLSNCI